MSKVITFSRLFPKGHINEGKPTYFAQRLYTSFSTLWPELVNIGLYGQFHNGNWFSAKKHTIRKGNCWHVGEKFSPRIWQGKPYASKQTCIFEDIEIKKIFSIQIDAYNVFIDGKHYCKFSPCDALNKLAYNDGLSMRDFIEWFALYKMPFTGQIICWDETVNY